MGFAQQGRNAAEILAHYYSGTALGTTDPNQQVRVLLVPQTKAARITGARAGGLAQARSERHLHAQAARDLAGRAVRERAPAGDVQRAAAGRGRRRGHLARAARAATAACSSSSPTSSTACRSSTPSASRTTCRASCPRSRPASWPAEALKAQAITARTYAITTAKSDDFDHYADTRSQVYKGVGIEVASTNKAIADTRGQIVTYQGQPVVTYFFSTSGGRTESVENTNLGNEPKPWLKSVEDPYDNVSPRHRWTLKPSKASVAKKLGGLVKGSFKGIRVTKRGESPRIMTAEVVGSRGVTRDRRADAARAARALRHVGVVHGDQDRQERRRRAARPRRARSRFIRRNAVGARERDRDRAAARDAADDPAALRRRLARRRARAHARGRRVPLDRPRARHLPRRRRRRRGPLDPDLNRARAAARMPPRSAHPALTLRAHEGAAHVYVRPWPG